MKFRPYSIATLGLVSILFMALIAGCKKQNDEDLIPAYIQIDTIKLAATQQQGGNSHKITDAWIFVDNQPLGCFELPCKVPVLKSGKHNISVRAGIKLNGIAATRVPYPFYQFYSIDSVMLTKTETVTLAPTVSYFNTTLFPYLEDFSSGSTSILEDPNSDTTLVRLTSGPDLLNGACGALYMPPGVNNVQVYNTSNLILPGNGKNVFLELDYKNEIPLYIGLFVNTPSSIIANQIIGLNPSPTRWNKIYVNLTPEISSQTTATGFRLFFRAIKSAEDSTKNVKILIDNVKIVTIP